MTLLLKFARALEESDAENISNSENRHGKMDKKINDTDWREY